MRGRTPVLDANRLSYLMRAGAYPRPALPEGSRRPLGRLALGPEYGRLRPYQHDRRARSPLPIVQETPRDQDEAPAARYRRGPSDGEPVKALAHVVVLAFYVLVGLCIHHIRSKS